MRKTVNTIRAILLFTILIFVLIFCFQNKHVVSVRFLKAELKEMPLFIVLIATLAGGILIGFLAGMISGTKSKRNALRDLEEKQKLEQRPTKTQENSQT